MKNILVYSTGKQGVQESLQIEMANDEFAKGNNVYFLHCASRIGFCNDNPTGHPVKCAVCSVFQNRYRKKYLNKGIKVLNVNDYIDSELLKKASVKFDYSSSDELMQLEYHHVEIGMGTMSSYISQTRNLYPKINSSSKKYFDDILTIQVILTLILEKLHNEYNFNEIIFHNGRFAQYKPFLNFAQNNNIDFLCTESFISSDGYISKNNFLNSIPHDINANKERYLMEWNNSPLSLECKERIGIEFYERKRNAKGTGDKVYTENQIKGELLKSWDNSKKNIVIFNSSEDEFNAISKDYNKGKLFKNQLEGIKTILNHYKDNNNYHFYIRVHPNLSSVNYKYHKDIYNLKYNNLTVISAKSKVDTYALIDNAYKVIVFGSTVGIESVYANKPVICLGPALYNTLDVVYHPDTIENIWKLIDNSYLESRNNVNVLKYGFFYMSVFNGTIKRPFKFINNTLKETSLMKKKTKLYNYEKILGSNVLFASIRSILYRIYKLTSIFAKHDMIPTAEEE